MRWIKQTALHLILLVLTAGWIWSLGVNSVIAEPIKLQTKDYTFSQTLKTQKLLKQKPVARGSIIPNKPFVKPLASTQATTNVFKKPPKLVKKTDPLWPYRPNIDCLVMRCVALTFDDGPSPSTGLLLDILKNKNAVATFFVVGFRAEQFKPVLQRMIAEDSEIGNHSYSHKNYKKISVQGIVTEINMTQDVIFAATGYRPHIIRPPYGEFPAGNPTMANYPIIFWNNDPADWRQKDPKILDTNVITPIKPNSIVIMHDLYPSTVNAVPDLIENLQKQGYVFVTISELFGWRDAKTPLPNGQLLRGR